MRQPRPNVSKHQLGRSRELRKNPTWSEEQLWSLIKANQLGVRFKRQVPIGRWIVDFLCPSKKLVVELDGSSHEHTKAQDDFRDSDIKSLGYRILRITVNEIETGDAIAKILAALED